jgi:hypothetical protein
MKRLSAQSVWILCSSRVHHTFWVESISQDRDSEKGEEKDCIETEENNRQPIQPCCFEWNVEENMRHNARAHRDREP